MLKKGTVYELLALYIMIVAFLGPPIIAKQYAGYMRCGGSRQALAFVFLLLGIVHEAPGMECLTEPAV